MMLRAVILTGMGVVFSFGTAGAQGQVPPYTPPQILPPWSLRQEESPSFSPALPSTQPHSPPEERFSQPYPVPSTLQPHWPPRESFPRPYPEIPHPNAQPAPVEPPHAAGASLPRQATYSPQLQPQPRDDPQKVCEEALDLLISGKDEGVRILTRHCTFDAGLTNMFLSQCALVRLQVEKWGRISGYELVATKSVKDIVRRYVYLCTYEKALMWWEFTFYRGNSGWLFHGWRGSTSADALFDATDSSRQLLPLTPVSMSSSPPQWPQLEQRPSDDPRKVCEEALEFLIEGRDEGFQVLKRHISLEEDGQASDNSYASEIAVLRSEMEKCGRPLGYELVATRNIKDILRKYVYVCRYENKFLCWEFIFFRTSDRWLWGDGRLHWDADELLEAAGVRQPDSATAAVPGRSFVPDYTR